MSSSLLIFERPSIPTWRAFLSRSSFERSSYALALPPLRPLALRLPAFAIRAAFSLLSPWRRRASYWRSSLTLGPWSFAIVVLLCPVPTGCSRSAVAKPLDRTAGWEYGHGGVRARARPRCLGRARGRGHGGRGDDSGHAWARPARRDAEPRRHLRPRRRGHARGPRRRRPGGRRPRP